MERIFPVQNGLKWMAGFAMTTGLLMVVALSLLPLKAQAAAKKPSLPAEVETVMNGTKKLPITRKKYKIKKVVVKTGNPAVAKARATKKKVVIYGVSAGETRLITRIKAKKGKKTRIFKLVTTVTVNSPTTELSVDTIQLDESTAVSVDNVPKSAIFLYESSEPEIAAVSPTGVVTGEAVGSADITVKVCLPKTKLVPARTISLPPDTIEVTESEKYTLKVLHEGSEDHINRHHVYGSVCMGKRIFVFAEGRVRGQDAGEPHDIVMFKSEDEGISWECEIVVDSQRDLCSPEENRTEFGTESVERGHCFANPTPVVDSAGGTLYLLYAENFDNVTSKVYVISSKNFGKTWSRAVDITGLFSDDLKKRGFHLPGPGNGIQLKKGEKAGRLVVPVWHRKAITEADRDYGVSCIYSDDHGRSWTNGEYLKNDIQFEEAGIVEDQDGTILMNARNIESRVRIWSVSRDGGRNWDDPYVLDEMFTGPSCDAGFCTNVFNDRFYYFLSYPLGRARDNLYLFMATDLYDNSWINYMIFDGEKSTGYSNLIPLDQKTVGVLYSASGNLYYRNYRIYSLLHDYGEDEL